MSFAAGQLAVFQDASEEAFVAIQSYMIQRFALKALDQFRDAGETMHESNGVVMS
jgi:hypothetical protein